VSDPRRPGDRECALRVSAALNSAPNRQSRTPVAVWWFFASRLLQRSGRHRWAVQQVLCARDGRPRSAALAGRPGGPRPVGSGALRRARWGGSATTQGLDLGGERLSGLMTVFSACALWVVGLVEVVASMTIAQAASHGHPDGAAAAFDLTDVFIHVILIGPAGAVYLSLGAVVLGSRVLPGFLATSPSPSAPASRSPALSVCSTPPIRSRRSRSS
jgi:hypothetical protein